MIFYTDFIFREGQICRYPTVQIVTSEGRVIQCHRTLTKEEWRQEPWYGRLAILNFLAPYWGFRLWIYTRWGCCHFDIYTPRWLRRSDDIGER